MASSRKKDVTLISKNCIILVLFATISVGLIANFYMASSSSYIQSYLGSSSLDDRQEMKTDHPNIVDESSSLSLFDSSSETKVASSNLRSGVKKKIAYAITVTKDGPFIDGALVLGYSARKIHDISKGFKSNYDADLVAFVAPKVVKARAILERFGWIVLERDLPVALTEIRNPSYAKAMKDSGCCGADEFLKLWAYTLTQYHRVVHLDMDSVIYQNMDELYELDKEMLYTGDYNMQGSSPVPPAQGGFLVVRPSTERFKELQEIIREGDHGPKGWGGSRIGNFWGGQTIQGIVPYFYYSVHPGDAQELNICIYNCMVDNPYRPETKICLNKKPTCEDCRLQLIENVKSAHFTICQKPWNCNDHVNPRNARLCSLLHNKWFELRDEFEKENEIDLSYRKYSKDNKYKEFLGTCTGYGEKHYLPIPVNMSS